MDAAENISDLRTLLSIVAEETGALKMSDADEDSVGWTTEGQLPMTFGHVRRAHSALAALEAALSAAKPVAWLPARRWEHMTAAEPWLTNIVYSEDQAKFFPCIPLYAAPPAPSVAAKAFHRQADNMAFIINHMGMPDQWREKFMRELGEDRSALSAQVQDVAPTLKIGIYGKAYDRPDERRAYTYDHQPQNVGAHKLGRACSEIHSGGDWIDRGLNLLNSLQREGFGVFELPAAPAKQEGGNVTSQ